MNKRAAAVAIVRDFTFIFRLRPPRLANRLKQSLQITRVSTSCSGFPGPIVDNMTSAIDRGDRGDVAMVVLRHQRLLLRRDAMEVHDHEVNPIAELWVQLDQTFGLTCGIPAIGGSKENKGRLAGSDRGFGNISRLDREVRA
jgi:hypothetical protein